MAITKYDQFDFLIDIVPREEIKPTTATKTELTKGTAVNSDQVNIFYAKQARTGPLGDLAKSWCVFPPKLERMPKPFTLNPSCNF